MVLEIATFSIEAAILSAASGADRIELCDNPHEGGTTPSFGTLKWAIEHISIPVFPIIRPRGGNFYFSEAEWQVTLHDVLICKQLGFEGIVSGVLLQNKAVDYDRISKLVELAYPMEVTFHKAFDKCPDLGEALEIVIAAGCQRVLTSGGEPNAFAGKDRIAQLVQQADDRIVVMPGGGVRKENIAELISKTGVTEIHSGARKLADLPEGPISDFQAENEAWFSVDPNEIKAMQAIISSMEN